MAHAPAPDADGDSRGEPSEDQGLSLSHAEIGAVVEASVGRIQRCYERQLHAYSELSGRVTLGWIIDEQGSVRDAAIVENDLPDAVSRCILHIIEELRFPVPRGGPVTVDAYPFRFQMISRSEGSSPPPATP